MLPFWSVAGIPVIYLLALASRYQRVLPYSLRNCKFIRLDKLREMQELGIQIKRCQELPTEIFGNASYAVELIITSHRWLNRFTCDVTTYDHPNGLYAWIQCWPCCMPTSRNRSEKHTKQVLWRCGEA